MSKSQDLLELTFIESTSSSSVTVECICGSTSELDVVTSTDGRISLLNSEDEFCQYCGESLIDSYVYEPTDSIVESLSPFLEKATDTICAIVNGKKVCGDTKSMKEKAASGKLKLSFSDGKMVTPSGKPKVSVAIPPNVTGVKVNTDPAAKLYAIGTMKLARGGTSEWRVYNPLYSQHRASEKHGRVSKLIKDGVYKQLISKWSGELKGDSPQAEAAGLLYSAARTGQRIGSKVGTTAGKYDWVGKKGKTKKVVSGETNTYALSSLLAKHVKINGNTIEFSYPGKKAVEQKLKFNDLTLITFYKKMLKGKKPDDRVHSPTAYKMAYSKLKSDTGGKSTIKDLRTIYATQLAQNFRSEWERKNGKANDDKKKREMIKFVTTEVSDKLGNKPGEAQRSYIDPSVLV